MWCCDASTFTDHENDQTSNLENTIKGSVQITDRHSQPTLVCGLCVFFPLILDIKFVGSTSRGHAGFLVHLPSAVRAFIFLARSIQSFLSLVDREGELKKKSQLPGSNSLPKCKKVTRLPSELPGKKEKKQRKRTREKKLDGFKRKIRTRLDLVSIAQSGGEMSKRLGRFIGCKYETSSWHLNGFPHRSNIGSTVCCRGETHRYTCVLL